MAQFWMFNFPKKGVPWGPKGPDMADSPRYIQVPRIMKKKTLLHNYHNVSSHGRIETTMALGLHAPVQGTSSPQAEAACSSLGVEGWWSGASESESFPLWIPLVNQRSY